MRKALSEDDLNYFQDKGLVETTISHSGVATIKLNDTLFYNGWSKELMSDLLLSIQIVSSKKDLKALIFSGSGAHFCTGAILHDTKGERTTTFLDDLHLVTSIAAEIRKLSVPTLAVIHGRVVGGGMALAMASDWRICPKGTELNYGNLPRGMSCVMNLSKL